MAVIEYRIGLSCRACGEVKLESEQLSHRDGRYGYGSVCPSQDRRDGAWRRQQVIVLLRSNLHQELRWATVKQRFFRVPTPFPSR